jgi:uncharacterized protein with NAD-binding domain and iron-sulfur cluster
MEQISRRRALQIFGGGVAAATINSSFSLARAATRRPTVAIFGGGIAGLTTAHELAERGFDVSVYESRQWGGKVRSFGVPGTGSGGRAPLPAEHAIHHIFGMYRNLPDTLHRIPFGRNPNGVWDNLVPLTGGYQFAHADEEADYTAQTGTTPPNPLAPDLGVLRLLLSQLPAHEAAWVLQRIAVYLSSSDERRFSQWERISWWDFLGGAELSTDTQKALVRTLVQNLAGQPAKTSSARSIGSVVEAVLWHSLGRTGGGPTVHHFDRPKNEAFIQPWVDHLTAMGARLHVGWTLEGLDVAGGRIAAARVLDPAGREQVITADHYVSTLPVERTAFLRSPEVLELAPELAATAGLKTLWSNSVMLYLRRPVHFTHGQVAFMDSPWALLGATQAQFWRHNDFARDFGDGTMVDCMSVSISAWDEPGIVYGKAARDCSAAELGREIWAQMQRHCNLAGEPELDDDLLAQSYADPGLVYDASGSRIIGNQDPLASGSVDSWSKRPDSVTSIPNLLLAGDWVRNGLSVAATDAANESGKRAAAAIVAESGVRAEPVVVNAMYRAPELEALQLADAALARRGLPHVMDVPEGVHGVGLATDILETVEQTLGLKVPKVRI